MELGDLVKLRAADFCSRMVGSGDETLAGSIFWR